MTPTTTSQGCGHTLDKLFERLNSYIINGDFIDVRYFSFLCKYELWGCSICFCFAGVFCHFIRGSKGVGVSIFEEWVEF